THVPTITRLVKLFGERETELAQAVRAADAAKLRDLLADDFEMRVGVQAATPIPRAAWIDAMMRTRDPGGAAQRVAVHDLGDGAIASFVQEGDHGAVFVIDVWRKQGTVWKLAIRYTSPTGTADFPIPGAAPTGEIPKKY